MWSASSLLFASLAVPLATVSAQALTTVTYGPSGPCPVPSTTSSIIVQPVYYSSFFQSASQIVNLWGDGNNIAINNAPVEYVANTYITTVITTVSSGSGSTSVTLTTTATVDGTATTTATTTPSLTTTTPGLTTTTTLAQTPPIIFTPVEAPPVTPLPEEVLTVTLTIDGVVVTTTTSQPTFTALGQGMPSGTQTAISPEDPVLIAVAFGGGGERRKRQASAPVIAGFSQGEKAGAGTNCGFASRYYIEEGKLKSGDKTVGLNASDFYVPLVPVEWYNDIQTELFFVDGILRWESHLRGPGQTYQCGRGPLYFGFPFPPRPDCYTVILGGIAASQCPVDYIAQGLTPPEDQTPGSTTRPGSTGSTTRRSSTLVPPTSATSVSVEPTSSESVSFTASSSEDGSDSSTTTQSPSATIPASSTTGIQSTSVVGEPSTSPSTTGPTVDPPSGTTPVVPDTSSTGGVSSTGVESTTGAGVSTTTSEGDISTVSTSTSGLVGETSTTTGPVVATTTTAVIDQTTTTLDVTTTTAAATTTTAITEDVKTFTTPTDPNDGGGLLCKNINFGTGDPASEPLTFPFNGGDYNYNKIALSGSAGKNYELNCLGHSAGNDDTEIGSVTTVFSLEHCVARCAAEADETCLSAKFDRVTKACRIYTGANAYAPNNLDPSSFGIRRLTIGLPKVFGAQYILGPDTADNLGLCAGSLGMDYAKSFVVVTKADKTLRPLTGHRDNVWWINCKSHWEGTASGVISVSTAQGIAPLGRAVANGEDCLRLCHYHAAARAASGETDGCKIFHWTTSNTCVMYSNRGTAPGAAVDDSDVVLSGVVRGTGGDDGDLFFRAVAEYKKRDVGLYDVDLSAKHMRGKRYTSAQQVQDDLDQALLPDAIIPFDPAVNATDLRV
ncbi:hypothetical protein PV10_00135 [Exophiala mesophila]|uniref:Uncharacterized protein n=1 Tax=Exophiala mesophila TaxID=212818 RepID=A0A0D1Y6D0_EXOME|nr:uncharacterized protein PV10_00135 [Exophiala mesophila]KIV96246.1 hypothetical protein PV10_00135 [Exophiala mesophila]